MARILLLIFLLLPLARPVLPETPVDVRLQYIERDLDRLRQEIGTRPEMARVQQLEAEIAGLRAEIEKAGKALDEGVRGKLDLQDKRVSDLHSSVTRWGTIVPILLAIIAALGAWKLQSDQKKSVKEWLEQEGKTVAEEVVRTYAQSDEGNKKLGEAAATILTPQMNESLVKYASERVLELTKDQNSEKTTNLPTLDAQAALAVVMKQPEDQRTPEAWRALIYSYSDSKRFEAALTLVDHWLVTPTTPPEHTAQALRIKGNVLLDAGRPSEAIAAYDDVLARFGSDSTPALREQVGWALLSKGVALGKLAPPKTEEKIDTYTEVVARFGSDPAPALREQVARALFNKGVTLGKLTPPQTEEEIAAYAEVVSRFGSDPAPALREQVAKALFNKGVTLGELAPPKTKEKIAAYTEVVSRFGGDPAPALREHVASALFNKGVALGKLAPPKTEEEIAAYTEVVSRFGSDPAPALREQVARALHYKAITKRELRRPDDARAVGEDYLRRFGDAPEPAIQKITTKVRILLSGLPPPEVPPSA